MVYLNFLSIVYDNWWHSTTENLPNVKIRSEMK